MSKGNKRAKEELIRLYGPECFIERLHLRAEKDKMIQENLEHIPMLY